MTFTTRPEILGTFGAVASTHWLASAVGMSILERGGNAFDAVAAAGFTLQVVEPHLNGPGGEVPILCAPAGSSQPVVICGQGTVPAAATIAHFRSLDLDLIPGTGLLAACVPGAFGAWVAMLREWGTLSLRDVLLPAIGYAINGYPLVSRISATIASVEQMFRSEWPSSTELYLPYGAVPQAGSLFRNPALGALYQRLLDHAEAVSGREKQIDRAEDFWYRGPVAETIDRFCRTAEVMDVSGRRHRGLLTGDDMAGWRAGREAAVGLDHRDCTIWQCGGWSQGPVLLQMLGLLQPFSPATLDPLGPDFVHLFAEAAKLAMADRDAWYGEGGAPAPLGDLLSPSYAEARRTLIGEQASMEFRPGSPGGRPPCLPPVRLPGAGGAAPMAGGGEPTVAKIGPRLDRQGEAVVSADGLQRGDTCHVDVTDRWGNMVSATPSGGWLQSNPVIPGLGFALTTRAQMCWLQEGLSSSLVPGRRPRTTLTPSLAYRDGAPYLAFGTPGGDQQAQWSLLMFLYHIDHGMNLQEAIDAPSFHSDHLIASFWPREAIIGGLVLEDRFPRATIAELERRGHKATLNDSWSEGRLSACSTSAGDGGRLIKAAANPRGMQGYAIGR